jgi:hypothetical protein
MPLQDKSPDKLFKIAVVAKKVFEVIVVAWIVLLILKGGYLNDISIETGKLISGICFALFFVAYGISTLFKNLICRCIRCPAI